MIESNNRNTEVRLEALDVAREMLAVIEDKKGIDILILDIRSISLIADYFVIATAETGRQVDAMLDGLAPRLKDLDRRARVEGESDSGWVLVDGGDVIVHLFSPAQRRYYALEELWKEAKTVVRVQ